jgi:hypothetical protein
VPADTQARALAFAAAMITIPSGAGFTVAAVLLEAGTATAVLGAATTVYTALALTLTALLCVRRSRGSFPSRLPRRVR